MIPSHFLRAIQYPLEGARPKVVDRPPVPTGPAGAMGPEPVSGAYRVRSVSVLTARDRRVYWAFVAGWIATNLFFWTWWLNPEHVRTGWFYVIFTLAFFYAITFLPTMYLFYVGKMRRPVPVAAQPGLKVAMITLCVPSAETVDVIIEQLEAMIKVRYPHDSWVLDEGNHPAIREAAERLGVRYFTRKGVPHYNQPNPPFKAKTKAGNVNAWLDAHGDQYDFFIQLDIDHRPEPDYLDRTLGYFRDPHVAWVQGPSLYNNLETWISRGSAEQELVLQGPLQQGFFGASETPFIIGSHCSYRTRAINEIGGFQPTRAEDHLDTVKLASLGYRGVFVPEVLALGDGPETFETYLRQQFAWAFSMIEVLFTFTPRLVWRYRPIQAVQFLFAQTWYPFWSMSSLLLFVTPLLALITGARMAATPLPVFLAHWVPIDVIGFLFYFWTRKWHLPKGLNLTWRGMVLHVARWPIVFWAFLNVVFRVKHPYMITPKGGADGLPTFSLRSQMLYLIAVWISTAIAWAYIGREKGFFLDIRASEEGRINLGGFVLLALWGCVFMLAVVLTNMLTDAHKLRQLKLTWARIVGLRRVPIAIFAGTLLAILVTMAQGYDLMLTSATWLDASAAEQQVAQNASEGHAREILGAAAALSSFDTVAEGLIPIGAAVGQEVSAPPLPLDLPRAGIMTGSYDPWGLHLNAQREMEHWYVHQNDPHLYAGALARARSQRAVMVTVEPWPDETTGERTLEAVSSGAHDGQIRELARITRVNRPQTVLLRWGHEMELSVLYPWSNQDPEIYKAAFRRVVSIFRQEGVDNVRFVWSPAGNVEAALYYPGDDVVDYVGLTILGDEGWDRLFGMPPQSFAELMRPKYDWLSRYEKPIIVAELGVSGTEERRREWLTTAAAALPQFPLVRAVLYFNAINAQNNRLEEQPDWRIGPELLAEFTRGVQARQAELIGD